MTHRTFEPRCRAVFWRENLGCCVFRIPFRKPIIHSQARGILWPTLLMDCLEMICVSLARGRSNSG